MKKILIVLMFLLLSRISLNAEEISLYNDYMEYFSDGDTICSNKPYYMDSTTGYKEVVILDAQTHVILEVLNTNAVTTELVFPDNAGEIIIVTTEYDESGVLDSTTEETLNLSVENCEYSVVKEDYNAKVPAATFEVSNTNILVTPPTKYDDYVFTFKFVEEENGKEYDNSEAIDIALEENTIIQFTETFTNEEGKLVTNYYELEINSDTANYYIRNVNSFEISTIDAKELINFKALLMMMILFLLLLIMRNKHRRLKRKIKNKEAKKEGRRR